MQDPTGNPEGHEGDSDSLEASRPKEEHEHQPEDANANTHKAENKLSGWLQSHWEQLKELRTNEKLNLCFTFVIAFATLVYVFVAVGQLKQMKKASELQRQIARFAYGEAIIHQSQLFVYCDEQVKQMRAEVKFQNDGKADATFIRVSAQMAFRDSDPRPREYGKDFKDAFPNQLSTFVEAKGNRAVSTIENGPIPPAYKGRRLYVWGTFRYEDPMGPKGDEMFCLWGPEQNWPDIFKNPAYGGRWADCRTPANK